MKINIALVAGILSEQGPEEAAVRTHSRARVTSAAGAVLLE